VHNVCVKYNYSSIYKIASTMIILDYNERTTTRV